MAEALLRHALPAGSMWRVESAGVATCGGLPASGCAKIVMNELGAPIDPLKESQPLTRAMIANAALIVPLTRAHADAILELDPSAQPRVRLLTSFLVNLKNDNGWKPLLLSPDIPDPIGGTLETYRQCRDEIRACIPGVIEFLEKIQ